MTPERLRPHLDGWLSVARRGTNFLVHLDGEWTGPTQILVGAEYVDVRVCPSELAIREELTRNRPDGRALVVLTPAEIQSQDLLARVFKRGVRRLDAWEAVQRLFGVRRIDPLLAGEKWMAEALVEAAPLGGYERTASLALDAERAWDTLLRHRFGIDTGAGLEGLLCWAASPDVGRLQDRIEPEYRAIRRRLVTRMVGAEPVLAAVATGRGAQAVAIGLVMRVLLDGPAGEARAAARALAGGMLLGGWTFDERAARAFADAAEQFTEDRPTAHAVLRDAESVAGMLGAEPLAGASTVLQSGLRARLGGLGQALAARDRKGGIGRIEVAMARLQAHRISDHDATAEMALRLVRWLQEDTATAPDFRAAAVDHARDSAYADWGRTALRVVTGDDRLDEQLRALIAGADARRRTQDARFAELLAAYTAHAAAGAEILGVEEVVLVSGAGGELELTADWVATEANAARVVGPLHRGEKRLVFADSRARVESLAAALRAGGTTVFVSHSSLSADDRRQAERAFAETRECVIVSTSTLELGIDVGDLDRVIQVGAPATVASLLQRLDRTGRRARTARNCLFLATSDIELLQALALIRLVLDGWVEPLAAPAWPVNLVAQQLLARVLAEGRVGRSAWPGSLGRVREQAALPTGVPAAVLEHMLAREILVEDGGIVAIGPTGEQEYGRRNFVDVTSLFLTEPLLAVRWGQRDLGSVDPSSLATRDGGRATILLCGRAWGVRDVDWTRRIVWVEPVDEPGRSRWTGSGAALSIELCHAIRSVLSGDERLGGHLTRRAATRIDEIRREYDWVQEGRTTLVRDSARDRSRWWTFAGGRANRAVATELDASGIATTSVDDLGIGLRSPGSYDELKDVVATIDPPNATAPVDTRRIDALKFGSCAPDHLLEQMLERRDTDEVGVATLVTEPLLTAHAE